MSTGSAEVTDLALRPMDDERQGHGDVYAGISSSPFTPEQQAILGADLTDDEIAIRPDDGQLYMPQVHYRQRLLKAFGMGGWAIRSNGNPVVDRSQRTRAGDEAPVVYYTGLLYVNGRFVAEAMGKGSWIVNNPKSDYGTALESAKSDSLTRCCKDIGVAWQLWNKTWADSWRKEHAVCHRGEWMKKSAVPKVAAGANVPTSTAAKPGWAKVQADSPVVAEAKKNDETLASMAGGPVPAQEDVKFRKSNRAVSVADVKRHLDKTMPKVPLQRVNEAGRIEITNEKTGEITIEPKATNEQLARIHMLKDELRLDDIAYRLAMEHYYTVDTAALLTKAQASDMIDRLTNYKERGEGVR